MSFLFLSQQLRVHESLNLYEAYDPWLCFSRVFMMATRPLVNLATRAAVCPPHSSGVWVPAVALSPRYEITLSRYLDMYLGIGELPPKSKPFL